MAAIPIPEPEIITHTTWHNPTSKPVRLDLFTQADKRNPSGRVRYVIPPGGQETIPSTFDDAIQRVRDGVIRQGVGPMLRRMDGPPAKLHHALDAEAQEREKAERKAEAAAVARAQADAMAVVASREAQAAIREDETAKAQRAASTPASTTKSKPRRRKPRGKASED